MEHSIIVETIAPCGLNCGKCLANPRSAISKLSQELLQELGNFAEYADRFAAMDPVFEGYAAFDRILRRFAEKAECTGCRTGECLLKGCKVQTCVKDNGVEFCFQCQEFPCNRTGFSLELEKRWRAMNESMKKNGIEAFYAKSMEAPRY